jgi:hypothetical protein
MSFICSVASLLPLYIDAGNITLKSEKEHYK